MDLEFLNLDIKGKLNISLEPEDTLFDQMNMEMKTLKMKKRLIYFQKLSMK